MAVPGWPAFACWTASTASVRMVSIESCSMSFGGIRSYDKGLRRSGAHTASVEGEPIRLRTARLVLLPLTKRDEAEHARAFGDPANAARDTRSAEVQWREHGFGPWGIRDRHDNSFLGGAELRLAGDGVDGIAAEEAE